jgi:hypothetical protein
LLQPDEVKVLLRDLFKPLIPAASCGGGCGDPAAVGGAAAAVSPTKEMVEISDEEVNFVMRLGGPTTRAELSRKDMPIAFAVMEALKETRAHVALLFQKYDMNDNRNIEPHEVRRQPPAAGYACSAVGFARTRTKKKGAR